VGMVVPSPAYAGKILVSPAVEFRATFGDNAIAMGRLRERNRVYDALDRCFDHRERMALMAQTMNHLWLFSIPAENFHPYLHCTHQTYATDCHSQMANILKKREVPALIKNSESVAD